MSETFQLRVNGREHTLRGVDGDTPLLWVLRDVLGLRGTKFGCGVAQCGACTVLVDGRPTRSCVLDVSAAALTQVTTIEGLGGNDPVQQAWRDIQVPQCGFCQPGQIMSAVGLLREKPNPTDEDIDSALSGNICRCGTYLRIRAAVHKAAGGGGS